MPYAFAPGVSACRADGRLVILNLTADRYLMLPRDLEASVIRLIDGERALARDRAVHERLCTDGLVLQRSPKADLCLCAEPIPSSSLVDSGWPRPPKGTVIAAGMRAVRASAELRFAGLDYTLRRVKRILAPESDSAEDANRVAAAFAELRLVMRSLDRCLPLSIALARAAKRDHGLVRLVLGVACDPFRAHAWVQLDRTVLNDRLDTVRTFTPILAL